MNDFIYANLGSPQSKSSPYRRGSSDSFGSGPGGRQFQGIRRATGLLIVSLATWLSACKHPNEPIPQPSLPGPTLTHPTPTPPAVIPAEATRRACERKLRAVLAEPELPGAAAFEERRFEILTAAKAEPVLLTRVPQYTTPNEKASVAVRSFRTLLTSTTHPWDVVHKLLPHFLQFPQDGRETLLREGYLYADAPELAFALVSQVNAEHLFGHQRIWIQRGHALYHAERKRGRYHFVDGPNAGEQVRLLLLDRLGFGEVPGDALVRDLRSLRYQEGFREAVVRRMTADHMIANLKYGPYAVPTVLRNHGAELYVDCEIIDKSLVDEVRTTKAFVRRRQVAMRALQSTMALQVEDQLPFDEPRHEWGLQLDGALRRNWRAAYFGHKTWFAFNGDRYEVFNRHGRAAVPEVCVDFLTDTLERASGTWWATRGEKPALNMGRFDFNSRDVHERAKMRRVPEFVEYAFDHPGLFDVMAVPESARIELGDDEAFAGYLLRERREYQPGDIVVIRGPVPWDPRELHYHSFFIYETDPLTGAPIALIGNAGRPTVRNWSVEARRSPQRSIWYRLRPQTAWIESILPPGLEYDESPPPLSPMGNAG